MRPGDRWKGFCVGLAMSAMAVVTALMPQGPRNLCMGACTQCYACGLTVLPLLLWLAERRWGPAARLGRYLRDIAVRDPAAGKVCCGSEPGTECAVPAQSENFICE